jgi:hypothetical protein
MNFKRLLSTPIGVAFISILLGVGLATLFRKVCTDKNCIVFNGPVIDTITDKTYKYGEKCYKYDAEPAPCDSNKKIIDFASSTDENGKIIKDIKFFGK